MPPKFWLGFLLIPALTVPGTSEAQSLDGLNEASGVNQTIDEGFGARASGMGITFGGFQRNADAVSNAPAGMNDIDDFTFSTSHSEKFGEAKFDDFAFLFPFESQSTLGLGISRYGVSGIEKRPEGSALYPFQSPELFSIADYLMVAAFARRWGGLDVGMNFNLLYRQLDQDGIGMRGDAMAQYTWDDTFRIGALMKGLVPSSASWASGYMEYEPTDVYLAAAARFPTPYFYGSLQIAAQSEGLFQKQAKSQTSLKGSRFYEDPGNFISTTNLGFEYLFDFGLSCRFGLNELAFSQPFSSVATFGIGYNWRQILGLDYTFTPHPDLLSTHRISLNFTPAFPKFDGRDFRRRTYGGPPKHIEKAMPSDSPDSENNSLETAPKQIEELDKKDAETKAKADSKPSSIQANPLPAQAKPAEPKPAAIPQPAGEKEILEKDEEGQ